MEPKITAVIPTFRRAPFLKRTIESLLSQTFKNFLIYVFDNDSQDETKEVVESFSKKDGRISYFCHAKNIGMQANFRYALHQVKTPFVSLVSDDDFLFPWFYQEAVEKLLQFPEASFFSGTTVLVDEHDQFLYWEKNQCKEGYSLPLSANFLLPTTYWISSLFRTSMAQEIDFHPELISFDLDFLSRMCCRYPFYVSARPCAGYRSHPTSFSVKLRSQEFLNSFLETKKILREEFSENKPLQKQVEAYMRRFYHHSFFLQGVKAIAQGQFENGFAAAEILQKNFQDSLRSFLLKSLSALSQKSSLFYQFVCYLLFLRRKILLCFRKRGLDPECYSWIEKYKMEGS